MENTNFTHSKAGNLSKELKLFNRTKYQIQHPLWVNTGEQSQACLDINTEENKLKLSIKINDLEKSFIINPKNLEHTLGYLHKIISGHRTNNTKLVLPSATKKKDLLTELSDTCFKLENLEEFSKFLLNKSFLKGVSSLHFLYQEKGMSECHHYHFQKNTTHYASIEVGDFYQLFNTIKKTKDQYLKIETGLNPRIKILGKCLAKEFIINNFHFIFLITNEDFLDLSDENLESFNKHVYCLPQFYEFLILQKKITQLKQFTSAILNSIDTNFEFETIRLAAVTEKLNHLKQTLFSIEEISHYERLKLLGDLLNTLRHELSNPLFGLQLSSELLLSENLDDEQKFFIEQIKESIKRCQSILNNFTDLYNGDLEFSQVDLVKLIKEVFILSKCENKQINKVLTHDQSEISEQGQVFVHSNPTSLAQIFFNLIINSSQALNASELSEKKISINFHSDQQWTYINFKDNGPGITAEQSDKIFQTFYTTKKTGTGLGLAISKTLANKIGGSLEYIPSDKGAHFLLKLPYEDTHH